MPDSAYADRYFPPTAWTVLLSARDPASVTARQAREGVCQAYWQPVCAYLESLGLEHTLAQDVTQNVLARFCNDGWIERVDRAKGRLRHFFKAAARHALANHFRDAGRLKRGNGAAPVSVDELSDAELPHTDATGDLEFDRQWAWTLFDRAMRALEESYALRGKGALLEALKPALISGDELQPCAVIGSQFGVKESQIRIEIHRLRRRLADQLRAEVAATLGPASTEAEIAEETRYLVQILAHERAA